MSDRDEAARSGLSRRRLLTAGAAGLVGAAGLTLAGTPAAASLVRGDGRPTHQVWGEDDFEQTDDISPQAMISRNYLGTSNCHLFYEPTGNRTSFTFDETFYNRLGYWRTFLVDNSPDYYGHPSRVTSYGAYVNKPGYHGSGRAFDIGRIQFATTTGGTINFSCRYDQWRNSSDFDLHAKRYWGLAASLVRRFSYVITYPNNAEHYNHIHVDNAVYSLLDDCAYSSGRSTQTYAVQGACRYVWGHNTGLDGSWGAQTESHSTSVLRRIGRSSGTITTKANFQAFLTATYRKATNRQDY